MSLQKRDFVVCMLGLIIFCVVLFVSGCSDDKPEPELCQAFYQTEQQGIEQLSRFAWGRSVRCDALRSERPTERTPMKSDLASSRPETKRLAYGYRAPARRGQRGARPRLEGQRGRSSTRHVHT